MSLSDYRKIILHAGLHKTGTSYIQSVMNENTDALERRGIKYPRFRDVGKYGADHSIHQGNHSIIAVNYEKYLDVEAAFDRYVEIRNRCPTLLISGEGFSRYMRSNNFLEAFLKVASDAEVNFIFYIRRPDHLLESVYAQAVKNRVHGDIFRMHYRADYYDRIAPFIKEVGKENITVRPYNRKLWTEGDLGADFCATIGVPDLWRSIAPPSETVVNASLTRSEVFLLSCLESRPAKQRLARYIAENPEPLPDDGVRFFMSPEERREFNRKHVKSFNRLSKVLELGEMNEFLGIDENEEDTDWRPYRPDWEQLFRYTARFADAGIDPPRRPGRKS